MKNFDAGEDQKRTNGVVEPAVITSGEGLYTARRLSSPRTHISTILAASGRGATGTTETMSEELVGDGGDGGGDGGLAGDSGCKDPMCCLTTRDPADRRRQISYNTSEGRLWRMPACELRYGPLSCEFRIARTNDGALMDEEDLAQVGERQEGAAGGRGRRGLLAQVGGAHRRKSGSAKQDPGYDRQLQIGLFWLYW